MRETPGSVATEAALEELLVNTNYHLGQVENTNDNARETYHGFSGENSIKITVFPNDWFTVDIAFGEVRNIWANHTPLGEFGMAYASSQYHEPGGNGAKAIPGHDTEGLVYRIGAVAPKSRTGSPVDLFIESSDIVKFLLGFRHSNTIPLPSPQDLSFGAWEKATIGW